MKWEDFTKLKRADPGRFKVGGRAEKPMVMSPFEMLAPIVQTDSVMYCKVIDRENDGQVFIKVPLERKPPVNIDNKSGLDYVEIFSTWKLYVNPKRENDFILLPKGKEDV